MGCSLIKASNGVLAKLWGVVQGITENLEFCSNVKDKYKIN